MHSLGLHEIWGAHRHCQLLQWKRTNSYLTNYGQNVQLWTFGVTMVTYTCVIL
jgi:hypothetical protein